MNRFLFFLKNIVHILLIHFTTVVRLFSFRNRADLRPGHAGLSQSAFAFGWSLDFYFWKHWTQFKQRNSVLIVAFGNGLRKQEVVKVLDVVQDVEGHVEVVGLGAVTAEICIGDDGHENLVVFL